MNREQAINYLISRGFTHEQVGEVVRALTYKPTTKNDSSELEKNSKKLEKDFDESDCISRKRVLEWLENATDDSIENALNNNLDFIPSVTPQLSVSEVTALAEWTAKLTKASEDAYNKGYADGMKAQEPILDKLRAEIEQKLGTHGNISLYNRAIYDVLTIIDKYNGESEGT